MFEYGSNWTVTRTQLICRSKRGSIPRFFGSEHSDNQVIGGPLKSLIKLTFVSIKTARKIQEHTSNQITVDFDLDKLSDLKIISPAPSTFTAIHLVGRISCLP